MPLLSQSFLGVYTYPLMITEALDYVHSSHIDASFLLGQFIITDDEEV